MLLQENEKFLVLRYGTNIIPDCIEKHIEVINNTGYCWFGKIGVVPSQKALKQIAEQSTHRIVLYTKGKAYLCNFVDYTTNKPANHYPEYYNQYLFGQSKEPSIYFKLTSIDEIQLSVLDKAVVVSSRNRLQDTLNRSMSSYFLAEIPGGKEDVKATTMIQNKDSSKTKKELLPENDCRYRKDGKCTLKSCINYLYECDRPNRCLKQKR